jgi:hypothetical protein
VEVEVKAGNEILFGLYENGNVLVKDDPELLNGTLDFLLQARNFIYNRVQQIHAL